MSCVSVLIPDADAWPGLLVAHCLKASGKVALHGLSGSKTTPLRYSNLFTSFQCLEEGQGRLLDCVDEIVTKRGIDVVLPISNLGIRTFSEHRYELVSAAKLVDLPEPRTFDIATNKAALSEFLKAHGIAQPRTVTVAGGAKPMPETLSALSFPVLAKPPLSSGGNGIRRFDDRKQLESFLVDRAGELWIVQEFIEGSDLCVSALCRDGHIIASTEQRTISQLDNPYAPAKGIQFNGDSSATDLVRALIRKLGWSGVACIDLRLDARRQTPLVLELNGRYWTSLLGALKAGVNFPLLACEASLGALESNRQARKVRYFRGSSSAVLSLVGGGRSGIRPSETNLRYLARDPIPFLSTAVARIARTAGKKYPAATDAPGSSSVRPELDQAKRSAAGR